jgi:hypothetical protein
MKLLETLRFKYGFAVDLLHDGNLGIKPRPDAKLLEKLKAHKPEIVAELTAEREARIAEADAQQAKIQALVDSGRLTPEEADTHLLYVTRTVVAQPIAKDACPDCCDVLFWRYRGESAGLPLLCYSCHTPPDKVIAPECYIATPEKAKVVA